MKVFVAGASGALGRPLVRTLVADGHDVVGMMARPGGEDAVRALGAEPVIADGLDREAVRRAVFAAEPEVVIHEMTGLGGVSSYRNFDRSFELTNRLRTTGLDNLLDAANAVGARRFIAQSFGNWNYAREGGPVKTEEDRLDPDPPATMARSLGAIRYLERAVLGSDGAEGVVLRYANLYGPGASMGKGGGLLEQVRARKVPIVGDGAGVWSFVHFDDAAVATALAVERGAPGIYNVADDDPAPASVWVPELARIAGAKPPRRIPAWLARPLAGEAAVSMFTAIRGASNAKAKRELGWDLTYGSWRDGFRQGVTASARPAPERARALRRSRLSDERLREAPRPPA